MATFLFLQLITTGFAPGLAAVAAPNSFSPPYFVRTNIYQTLPASVNTPFSTALWVYVTDNNNAAVSGLTVTFTAPDGSTSGGATSSFGSSMTATAVTDVNGLATAPTLTANSVAGQYQVIASIPNSTSTVKFKLSNNNPTNIAFTSSTSQNLVTYPRDTYLTPPGALQVSVTNSNGSPSVGVTLNLSAPGSNSVAGAYVSGNLVTDDTGLTNATVASNGIQGSYQVTATVVGTALSTSTTVTNRVISHLITVTGANQSAALNSAFATPLQVLVTDGANQPVSGIGVRFYAPVPGPVPPTPTPCNGCSSGLTPPVNLNNQQALTATPFVNSATPTPGIGYSGNSRLLIDYNATATGTFNGQYSVRVTTGSDGIATAPAFVANNQTGSYRVEADVYYQLYSWDYQNINLYLTQYFTNMTNTLSAPPTQAAIVVTGGNNQSTNLNTAFATPLQVTVKDASGNLLTGQNVTFQAPSSGQGGTFANGSTSTTGQDNGNGTYSAVLTANNTPGNYNVTATVNGLSTPASFSLSNIAVSLIAVGGTPQSTTLNNTFGSQLQVQLQNDWGYPIQGRTVTFAAPTTGATGIFAGGNSTITALTDANGIATAPNFQSNNILGSYKLMATTPGLAPAEFDLANSTITQIITLYDQSAPINNKFPNPLKVGLGDASGNLIAVSGVHIIFVAPSSGGATGTFSNGSTTATAVTGSDGRATVSYDFTANNTIGNYTVYAYTNDLSGVTGVNLKLVNTPTSPNSTYSFYVTSLDTQTMYSKGCNQGNHDSSLGAVNPLVILDFGEPIKITDNSGATVYGTKLIHTGSKSVFAIPSDIAAVATEFAHGYWYCTGGNTTAKVRLVIGTNNYYDGEITNAAGGAWAQIVAQVNQSVSINNYFSQVEIAAGIDAETSFNIPTPTKAWIDGYNSLNSDGTILYDYGDASGCPSDRSADCSATKDGTGANTGIPAVSFNWPIADMVYVAYTGSVIPIPEIYKSYDLDTDKINKLYSDSVGNSWYWLSLYSANQTGNQMPFAGTLSSYRATGSSNPAYNSPQQSWAFLWGPINRDISTIWPLGFNYLTDIADE